MTLLVLAVSRSLRWVTSKLRLFWYNSTIFGYYRCIPLSTTVYGRILTLNSPTFLSLGKKCRIGDSVYFATSRGAEIVIGEEVNINLGCVFVASHRIEIGSRSSIAEYVTIRDQEHIADRYNGTRKQGYRVDEVKIGRNVWIGRGVYIGPGVELGDGCVVGANSVVKGKFPPGVLIAGSPAVIKRTLA